MHWQIERERFLAYTEITLEIELDWASLTWPEKMALKSLFIINKLIICKKTCGRNSSRWIEVAGMQAEEFPFRVISDQDLFSCQLDPPSFRL